VEASSERVRDHLLRSVYLVDDQQASLGNPVDESGERPAGGRCLNARGTGIRAIRQRVGAALGQQLARRGQARWQGSSYARFGARCKNRRVLRVADTRSQAS
jgi:hypothetical protein